MLDSGLRDCVVIGKLSFRMYVRNLKFFVSLNIKISPFSRNDKKVNCDKVSRRNDDFR